MFIDFLPLMLVNMAAGLFILACYGFSGQGRGNRAQWASAFMITGLIASICGFYIIFKFPLPGPYNIAFGEMSVMLGLLFLGGAWSVSRGLSVAPLAIYSLFAGAAAILIGVGFIQMKLSQTPVLAGVGFILTGGAGVLLGPAIWVPILSWLRWIIGIGLIVASGIWTLIAGFGYWNHLMHFANWTPTVFQNIPK